MDIKEALATVVERRDLSRDSMRAVMQDVMTGKCTESQIGGFLVALRMKSESIEEITAAVEVMRGLVTPVKVDIEPLVDIVGTGGDGANIFNVSTASAFVAAAAGAYVAKHGNRGVSSSSGSADVLESLGVGVGLPVPDVERSIRDMGLGFMFAPSHHSAMKHAIGARRELAMRTIFNILGPMTNPAGARRMLVGTFSQALCRPMAEVLQKLGSEHVMVVHAEDGLDEISLATQTPVVEANAEGISEYRVSPEQVGLQSQSLIGLEVDSPQASAALIKDALGKRRGQNAEKAADMIALNAGAGLYVSGIADSIAQGVELARDMILSGLALEKIESLAAFTAVLQQKGEA